MAGSFGSKYYIAYPLDVLPPAKAVQAAADWHQFRASLHLQVLRIFETERHPRNVF